METLKRRLLWAAVLAFSAVAAVAAILGCPVFRNPGAYATAGGAFAGLRQLAESRRVR